MWIVLSVVPWANMDAHAAGMVGFCPLFESREAAEKWADGRESVVQVEFAEEGWGA